MPNQHPTFQEVFQTCIPMHLNGGLLQTYNLFHPPKHITTFLIPNQHFQWPGNVQLKPYLKSAGRFPKYFPTVNKKNTKAERGTWNHEGVTTSSYSLKNGVKTVLPPEQSEIFKADALGLLEPSKQRLAVRPQPGPPVHDPRRSAAAKNPAYDCARANNYALPNGRDST